MSPESPSSPSPPALPTGTSPMQTSWGDLPVNDAHVHFFSHRFFQTLVGQSSDLPGLQAKMGWTLPPVDPTRLAERWATELNAQGVERASIIASVPGDESSVLAAGSACPNRFFPYAMINHTDPKAAVHTHL